jgi:predicted nucleic acid-binding protein
LTILDTDILVALLKGSQDATGKIRSLEEQGNRISTTIITAYELLKGAQISHNAQENLTKVRGLLSNLLILELSYNTCEEASEIYGELRKTGSMIGEFDILIGAITRACDETLLTRDDHFELIRGVKIIKW